MRIKAKTTAVHQTRREEGLTALLLKHEQAVRDIYAILRGAQSVLLVTHEHPDGDAVGSSLAMLHMLRALGTRVEAFVPDAPPEQFSFLPGIRMLTCVQPAVGTFSAVVVLDATYFARTHLAQELAAHAQTLTIDHHYDNRREAGINLIVPEAAATAHILAAFFAVTNTPLTKDMATCLLTGIFTDTGSFMHDSTTPDILKLAAHLMSKGARLAHIAHHTYQKKELGGLRIWGRALSRVMHSRQTGAAISVITLQDLAECGATLEDLSGVVNMLNTLPDTKFALLLTEYQPGRIKGSLRSEPHKGIDVSVIAKNLGGGGHKLAAGFEVPGHIVHHQGQWRVTGSTEGARYT